MSIILQAPLAGLLANVTVTKLRTIDEARYVIQNSNEVNTTGLTLNLKSSEAYHVSGITFKPDLNRFAFAK